MGSNFRQFYEFGPFRLESKRPRLRRDGKVVPLSPTELETLLVLVRHAGEVLEPEAFMQTVWADRFVENANLTVQISKLRKKLGGAAAEYIETVPRLGYRFVADVREVREELPPLIIEKHTRSQTIIEEMVPEVSTEHAVHTVRSVQVLRASLSRSPIATLATVVLLSAITLAAFLYFRSGEADASSSGSTGLSSVRSIAVLPPKPLSDGAENASLSLGLADALITRLGSVRKLPVRPTSSIVRFLGGNQDPVSSGRALGVDAVLEGSLQRDQGRVRVTLRLINVRDGVQLWSGHFDEADTDIFQLQDAVSREVGQALFKGLSREENLLLTRQQTTNADAYAAYLKGNYFWSKRGEEATKSLAYFRQAIELDPNFAPAYAVLAAVTSTMPNASPEAETLIKKALQLDNTLPDAQATYGFFRMFHQWDWMTSERALDRAIELDPTSATAHHWKGVYLSLRGRLDEAKVEMHRALDLDPLSLIILADLGQIHYLAREYEQALDYCRRALALDGNFQVAHEYLIDIYRQKGMDQAAADEWIKRKFTRDQDEGIKQTKHLFGRSGLRGVLQKQLVEDLRRPGEDSIRALSIARNYLRLGKNEQGMHWLELAFAGTKTHWHPYLNVDPLYDSVRANPRFQNLLKQMNLV